MVTPPAKRLCELVLISPGRRIGREVACEVLFPNRSRAAGARALTQALAIARADLSVLGALGRQLLQADRSLIWAAPGISLVVDLELQEERRRSALVTAPGLERDNLFVLALADKGSVLEDEPYASWAAQPRDRLERARQDARLTLARDRSRGKGRTGPEAVIAAWEECLAHDARCEEAASTWRGVSATRA
ncbi:MAG TPA: hypothetical protein VME46_17290 [Acidimicrobiales bacterium]|nr:hypothetical protein [Acidimicrobiales bacterium]